MPRKDLSANKLKKLCSRLRDGHVTGADYRSQLVMTNPFALPITLIFRIGKLFLLVYLIGYVKD